MGTGVENRERLRSLRTFPQLVRYLRDELDWPITSDDFEELTFAYTPAELGIDAVSAAKIEEIKRLRPLSVSQPWGIFFVKFEPKRLPVVALRRMLSSVVIKKRASANRAERPAWDADDLLFISNYGQGEERHITFAHFSHRKDQGGLATLRVLGWDELDTPLHLDDVADTLSEYLRWPADGATATAWRELWASAFTTAYREAITTSRGLAEHLAALARAIRGRILGVLAIEVPGGPLRALMENFRSALLHDLDDEGFADTYAQTIAYGLLSARVAKPMHPSADDDATSLPITSPFLKELLETFLHLGSQQSSTDPAVGLDFDELGVTHVVDVLDVSNMEAVLNDFGDRNPEEDPVIHFYELFLEEYNPREKVKRGVFFTPRPVVSHIVRSIDQVLRVDLGLRDGIADTTTWAEIGRLRNDLTIPSQVAPEQAFVQILDPATGTGTFLVECIDLIYDTMRAKWASAGHDAKEIAGLWNDYVPLHLLPRLHGFELLMAPYAIAHLKIGLKLYETGYRFHSEEPVRVYLTNSLEPPVDFAGQFSFAVPALAHEAQAVSDVKRLCPFTVVMGNPPYAGHSANNQVASIVELVYDYKRGVPELQRPGQAKWLQDDYVKFIRLAEHSLASVPAGVLGYITNHSFIDNPTFVGMRAHLARTFPRLSILDLHGNSKKKEVAPDGGPDANVFDIQQGVAVMVGARGTAAGGVAHGDLFGTREAKYRSLLSGTVRDLATQPVRVSPPTYPFQPSSDLLQDEYECGIDLSELMSVNGRPAPGIVTTHDDFAISWTPEEAIAKVEKLLATSSESEARQLFKLCSQSQWSYLRTKAELPLQDWRSQVTRVLYRPFDWRWTIFNSHVAVHRRERVMRHMLGGDNLGLICTRQTKDEWCVLATHDVCAHKACSAYDINYLLPMLIRSDGKGLALGDAHPNVDFSLLAGFNQHLGRTMPPSVSTAQAVIDYAYAVFWSSGYRSRYSAYLNRSFPRIPMPATEAVFDQLRTLGSHLISFHTLQAHETTAAMPSVVGNLPLEISHVTYDDDTVWVDKDRSRGFAPVPFDIWNFHFGGFRPSEKWLKDRKGRSLGRDDVDHYRRTIGAIGETIASMKQIESVIETNGGWPGAFALTRTNS